MWTAAAGWLPWGAQAFARARDERCPVLLVLTARWCRHSAALGRTTLADPRVRALLERHFVAVHADADRRPDLADRYGLGALPTLAVLTPEGDILCGGTSVDADRLVELLPRVVDAYVHGEHLRAAEAPGPSAVDSASDLPVGALVDRVASAFDPVQGGWGTAPTFPVTAPVRLALALWRDEESAWWREAAITTLDAMGWGPLFDQADGGFFRSAAAADWPRPDREKLLQVNASLLSLYVEAYETLQLARYAERAEDIARYLQTRLADPVDGGWRAAQWAAGEDSPLHAGEVDPTLFTDANAAAISAALYAGEVLGDRALSEFAVRSLERVALACYRPGAGLAHFAEPCGDGALAAGDVRGLLDDHVALSAASLDASDATGDVVYRMLAEELVLHSIRTLWSEAAHAFADRPSRSDDIGLLGERRTSFIGNCAAARMLYRLAQVSGRDDLRAYGDRALAAMGRRAAAEGPLAAEFVLAVRHAGR